MGQRTGACSALPGQQAAFSRAPALRWKTAATLQAADPAQQGPGVCGRMRACLCLRLLYDQQEARLALLRAQLPLVEQGLRKVLPRLALGAPEAVVDLGGQRNPYLRSGTPICLVAGQACLGAARGARAPSSL